MSTNKNSLKIYLRQVKKHPVSFLLALIFMPMSVLLLSTIMPFYLAQAIGAIATTDTVSLQQNLVYAGLVGLGGVLANVIGFLALVQHEARVRTGLYTSVFNQLIAKDIQFFVNQKVGSLTSRFIDFVRSHVALQDLLIIRTLGFVISVVVGLVLVALEAPLLSLLLLVLIALVVLQVRFFTKIRKPFRHERKKLIGEIHGEAADSITNSMLVKTFAKEASEQATLEKKTSRLQKVFIKDISIFGVDGAVRNAIMVVTQIVGIGIAATMALNGELSVAIAVFALTYLQRISAQIFTLGELIFGYDEALLQAAPMSDILMQQNTVIDAYDATQLTVQKPSIEFQSVAYRYSDTAADVLQNISITIPAGQKVGLIGHSGAGKTTITHLLLRFSDVTEGKILIDDTDIRTVTQSSLRESIAYVQQEPMLFHRSLRENIAYGKPDASNQEIEAAAKLANAFDFIDALPDRFETLVGERGVKLSGGQRQRVAIARAILKDSPILVLDEATSALDSESEKLIQDALVNLMKKRTSIVIAHRLSTISKLDRILVLEDGKIVEDGSHEELLAHNGLYKKLWTHQSGGFIEE
jgi:ATP-binding cassette, subfamily B, bacterial